MQPQERQLVVNQLTASRDRIQALVGGLTAEQWRYRPADGRWSIGECLEHIMIVENRVLGLIGKKVGEDMPQPEKQLPAAQRDERDAFVSKALLDRTVGRQAPENARPAGQWADANQLLAEFRNTRQRTTEFAATTQGDLRSFFHAHGTFGELDCYQWLLVLSLHGARHAQQMEEIKAAAGFPLATHPVPAQT